MKDSFPVVLNKGQSLIELLAALSIISIVLMSLVMVGTMAVNNTIYSKQRAQASKYALEGIEKVRSYRDVSLWTNLYNNCLNLNSVIGLPSLPAPFSRSITCTVLSANKVEILVIVSWTDSKGTHSSQMNTFLTNQGGWK